VADSTTMRGLCFFVNDFAYPELTLNLQTAGQLGLVLPPEIVRSASKVYR
jgi:hypothetical protein